MTTPDLLRCPFCACLASMGEVYERDDRRYMSRKVECDGCDAHQRASIPYGEFSKMQPAEIAERLAVEAAEKWNLREVVELKAFPSNEADVVELVRQRLASTKAGFAACLDLYHPDNVSIRQTRRNALYRAQDAIVDAATEFDEY